LGAQPTKSTPDGALSPAYGAIPRRLRFHHALTPIILSPFKGEAMLGRRVILRRATKGKGLLTRQKKTPHLTLPYGVPGARGPERHYLIAPINMNTINTRLPNETEAYRQFRVKVGAEDGVLARVRVGNVLAVKGQGRHNAMVPIPRASRSRSSARLRSFSRRSRSWASARARDPTRMFDEGREPVGQVAAAPRRTSFIRRIPPRHHDVEVTKGSDADRRLR